MYRNTFKENITKFIQIKKIWQAGLLVSPKLKYLIQQTKIYKVKLKYLVLLVFQGIKEICTKLYDVAFEKKGFSCSAPCNLPAVELTQKMSADDTVVEVEEEI